MGGRMFLLLAFLIVLPLTNSLPNNLGFETGTMSSWTTNYGGGQDYTTLASSNWSSEGNYSAFLGGALGYLTLNDDHFAAINHTSVFVNKNDMVCLDIMKAGGGMSNWRVFSRAGGTYIENFADGEHNNTCRAFSDEGMLDVVAQGTADSCNNPDTCYARIFVDNIRIYQCNDTAKNGDETDVDCGGRCAPCANGKNCTANADCTAQYCSSSICKEAPSYPYYYNLNFETGLKSFWSFLWPGGNIADLEVNTRYASEGNYSFAIDSPTGGLPSTSGNSNVVTLIHNTTRVEPGEEVCVDFKKNATDFTTYSMALYSNGTLISSIPTGEYFSRCVNSTGNSSLGLVVRGTGTDGCGGDCIGNFFIDNFTIGLRNCTDGDKDRLETDVDCGGFCSKCLAGRSCLFNFDCGSGNCSSSACTAPPSCSNLVLDAGEEGIDCGSACNITCERALLERYAPVLYFHPDEQFFPTSIEAMLN